MPLFGTLTTDQKLALAKADATNLIQGAKGQVANLLNTIENLLNRNRFGLTAEQIQASLGDDQADFVAYYNAIKALALLVQVPAIPGQ
jgi:hypothetical protein